MLVAVTVAGYGNFLNDSALVISAVALAVGTAAREVIGSLVSGLAFVLDSDSTSAITSSGRAAAASCSRALRVTRVETSDGEEVTIANTTLTAYEFVRPYGRGSYRVVHEVGVGYNEDLAHVLDELTDVARDTDRVLADPPPTAFVDELDHDEVSIRVQYWIADPKRHDVFPVRSAYAHAVTERLHAEGITVSPTTERELTGRIRVEDASASEKGSQPTYQPGERGSQLASAS